MELVTEPDFRTGEEVRKFGEDLQRILRYIGASDANMEKGQMRVEVNISLRPVGQKEFGTKVEVKNINSFKFAADAVDYEIRRQTELLERGGKVVQETRGWNERKDVSFSQRSKEEAHDYRYFPEPDLPPLRLTPEYVAAIRATIPELPEAKHHRFVTQYELDSDAASVLTRDKELADYFEHAATELGEHDSITPDSPRKHLFRTAAALLTGDFLRLLRETSATVKDALVTPENFAELTLLVAEEKISNTAAKEVLATMVRTGEDPSDIVEKNGLWQMSDAGDLENITAHILRENSQAVADYRNGKTASLQFLVGQVMKETRGKAKPPLVQEIVKKLLG